MRRSRAPELSTHIVILSAYSLLVLGNLTGTGLGGPSFGWIYVIVLAGILTTGRRFGWYWIVVGLLTAVGFWAFGPEPTLPAALPASGNDINSLVHRIAGILAVGLITTVAVSHQRQTAANLEAEIEIRKRAEREAKEADRIKGEFLANVSHEIRTPMNGVIGMTDLLMKAKIGASQQRIVEAIDTSAEILLALVDDLLDFSKIEAGKLSLYVMDFRLRDLLEKTLTLMAPRASEKGIELELSIAEDLPEGKLYGDAQRLRQVLLNLISNAIRFTAEGGVTVRVEQIEHSETEIMTRFSVRDTGVGIPQQCQQEIFSPFIQADNSTTRQLGGTGLGLAIARSLVETMGGEIGLDSEPHKGSEFWFRLPLWRARSAAPKGQHVVERERESEPAASATRDQRAGTTILVVDDDDINRLVAESQLEDLGFATHSAATGLEALDLLANRSFEVILMDCRMPELDGYETTRRIRQSETGDRRTVIIAVTAHAMKGERERCLEAGMDDYVSKPLRSSDLETMLDRWLFADTELAGSQTRGAAPEAEAGSPRDRAMEPLASMEKLGESSGRDLVAQMFDLFRVEGPKRLEAMKLALVESDADLMARTAHSLAGSAIYLGAPELVEVCRELERLAEAETLEPCAPLLETVASEVAHLTERVVASS
ncbi:MAG: ATP-binding protein [Acidobacteriota bacterium]